MKGKNYKKFMAKLYGWGASIVILGALFKIQHWTGAGVMLTIGLSTEAIIFFFSAFEKPHEDPDWSLVYPELSGMVDEEKPKSGTVTEELDKMLEEAKIGPELLQSLGSGLRNLSESTSKLSDISDAAVATNDYAKNMKSAASSVNELSNAYSKATSAITSLDLGEGDGKAFGKQLQEVSQKLSSLNAVYELQLQGSNDFLKSQSKLHSGMTDLMENLSGSVEGTKKYKEQMGELSSLYQQEIKDTNDFLASRNKLQSGITELIQNLGDSVDDTKKYKSEVATLAQNLSALNTVYGNMLSAMGGKK